MRKVGQDQGAAILVLIVLVIVLVIVSWSSACS